MYYHGIELKFKLRSIHKRLGNHRKINGNESNISRSSIAITYPIDFK